MRKLLAAAAVGGMVAIGGLALHAGDTGPVLLRLVDVGASPSPTDTPAPLPDASPQPGDPTPAPPAAPVVVAPAPAPPVQAPAPATAEPVPPPAPAPPPPAATYCGYAFVVAPGTVAVVPSTGLYPTCGAAIANDPSGASHGGAGDSAVRGYIVVSGVRIYLSTGGIWFRA